MIINYSLQAVGLSDSESGFTGGLWRSREFCMVSAVRLS